jgi:DNA gyrase subunit A
MPRKKSGGSQTESVPPKHEILQKPMDEVMHLSMIPYAEHVILERALPRVEDGLKPVQRRILFTLHELGVTPDKPHKKCARIVGDCLGKYHPHGDSSVYDAMVRMAQPYSLRELLVDGHGNFGSIDGDSAAAMRYTEARMAPLALEMLRDLDKDTVSFSFNFDDTLKEPDVLPSRFPNLLVNGASGIAVGLATNIPTHNLREAIDATLLVMDNPEVSTREIMKVMPAPDFPTGGCIINNEEIYNAYETGRGKLTVRSKVHIEEGSAGRKLIVITEVPYQVPKAQMLERILRLSEEKKPQLGGIYDIRDESDREGLRAVIEVRKDADVEQILSALYKYSDMQVTFGVNLVAIAEGRPMQMGVRTVLLHYIRHQENVVRRRTQYDLAQAKAREHILEGLMVAVDHLDEVIALIRASKTPKQAKEQLMSRYLLDDIQAQAILDLRLQRLTGLELDVLRREYEEILRTIRRLEGILKSEKKLKDVIRAELREIREKFGDDRRTVLIEDDSDRLPSPDLAPVAEETVILRLRDGQIRRVSPKTAERIAASPESAQEVAETLPSMSDETLYFFTNLGNCYSLDVAKLPESIRVKDRGNQLTALFNGLEEGERSVFFLSARSDPARQQGDLIFVTARGQVKRTPLSEYLIRRTKFAAIKLRDQDEVTGILRIPAEDAGDLLLVSSRGMAIRFRLTDVPGMGRTTAGVRGMTLEENDRIRWFMKPFVGSTLFLVSDRGFGKRLLCDDIDPQGRGGKGQKLMPMTRSGETGRTLSVCVPCMEDTTVRVMRRHSGATDVTVASLPVESRSARPRLIVSVLMDDDVTGGNEI